MVDEISASHKLTESERSQMLPSGKQTVISNRVHWARSYLKQAGLLQSTRRGWFELTERGREIALNPTIEVSSKFLEQFEEFQSFRSRSRDPGDGPAAAPASKENKGTPDESLQAAHQRLNDLLATALLANVRAASPAFFERLIIDLLLGMGYGGTAEGAGRAIGRSGDNGIDGVIDQDPLGVDQIYLQAKRYGPAISVSPSEIRDFYGALSIKRATKGLFFTTSTFSRAAEDTARSLGSRIVLIDGSRLTELMIRFGIGCRLKETLRIQEVDETYFDEE